MSITRKDSKTTTLKFETPADKPAAVVINIAGVSVTVADGFVTITDAAGVEHHIDGDTLIVNARAKTFIDEMMFGGGSLLGLMLNDDHLGGFPLFKRDVSEDPFNEMRSHLHHR